MNTTTESARTWSPQQEAIFGWFKNSQVLTASVGDQLYAKGAAAREAKNLVVRARAGTGKTTTILEGILRAPETNILVCAFNARIKDELVARNRNPNAEVKTLHGVGYACVRRYRERVRMEGQGDRGKRERSLVEAVCPSAPDPIKRLVGKLVTKGREMAPLAQQPEDLLDIALEFECDPDEGWEAEGFDVRFVCEHAVKAMALAADIKSDELIDFADQLFLPVRNGWLRKTYDLVVVDEAQDMSMTQLIIAQGVCRGRMVIVGDDRQAIYAFRGADSGSLDRLKAELQAAELGLTVTYRCAKRIVAVAQALVPDLQAADSAADGEVTTLPSLDKMIDAAMAGDFILSRANAPLARVAMALIRANKPARIQGKDIGAGLKGLVRRLATGRAANSMPEFLARLQRWQDRECERARAAGREDMCENIYDKADTLRCVCEGLAGVRELETRLDRLFADSGAGVVCSSVHKAKGLEAPKVFVLRSTLNPKLPPDAKPSPKRAREEANIHYVAVTRAQRHLCYVDGK